jgi:LPXTG-motif cell wall-anchored protein
MIKKLLAGLAIGVAGVLVFATPSFAAPTSPGVLETINSSGGTSATDGLKIDVAFGNIQIGRKGSGQIYDDTDLPSATSYGNVSSFPVVALSYGTSPTLYRFIGSSYGTNAVNWTSFTSESTLTDSGRSGTVINHLTYGSGTSLVTADFTISYTYPNEYFNVKFDLTGLGSDYSGGNHRLYWYVDSYLEGSDDGFEFGGTTPGGQAVAGVYSQAGTQIEAFRQVAGQNLDWYAGSSACPNYGPYTVSDCGAVTTNGFINDYVDFPSAFATNTTPIDNGFGVNSALSSAATDSMTFDLIFATCVDTSPLPCADSALGGTEPALPDTGVDAATALRVTLGALALVGLGGAVVLLRRRKQA